MRVQLEMSNLKRYSSVKFESKGECVLTKDLVKLPPFL